MNSALTVVMLVVLSEATSFAMPAPDLSYVRPGQCLSFKHLNPVSYHKFSGNWFEVSSRPNVFLKARMCVQSHFHLEDDKIVNVKTGLDGEGQVKKVTTTLHPTEHQSPEAEVRFAGIPTTRSTVVDIDYSASACLYQCRQVSENQKVEWGFALARDLKEASSARSRCKKVFDTLGFDVASLMPSVHTEDACDTAPIDDDARLPQQEPAAN
ncbi:crustacyanin-A1 subunit-like [Oratosquilla oratoria]|uniref:crustacyanin-A1 subunit-like n=1 Tax=Oratosquilla oratoria TaxID=337810 RepID=UPI003F7600E6